MPLSCQRHLFDLPDRVCYLDSAAWSPVPRCVREAGENGMLAKSQPWFRSRESGAVWAERARVAAASLIGAGANDVAIVSSVSHGIATAARNLPVTPGGRILRVAEEFPSVRFAWDRVAAERDLIVEEVPRPADSDWTSALLAAISRPGAAPLAVATLTPLHWSDGTLIDLDRLAPAVHAAGGALVIDATQAVGAMPVDVARWKPDFLTFPTYKWVLGPYSVAFLYAAPHRQDGEPLEANSSNRPPAEGARRYDKGERNDPIALPMAATGMELVAHWGPDVISARLGRLTDLLSEGAARIGLSVPPKPMRVPHILGLRVPGGMPDDLISRLQADDIFVSDRLGVLRVSPHVWVNEADVERLLDAMSERMS